MDKKPFTNSEYIFPLLEALGILGNSPSLNPSLENSVLQNQEQWMQLITGTQGKNFSNKLSFEFGKKLGIDKHGSLGYALKSTKNMREALKTVKAFIHTRTSEISVDLDEYDSHFSYNHYFSVEPKLVPLYAECLLAMSHGWFMSFNIPKEYLKFISINLNYDKPEHASLYDKYLNFDIRFNQPTNALVGPSSLLDSPNPFYNPALNNLALEQLKNISVNSDDTTISRVKSYLKNNINAEPNVNAAAELLHVSSRTLKRRLAKLNVTFSQLLLEVRCNMAMDLLKGTNLDIADIAFKVGYSHSSSFVASFKKALGVSPTAWRNSQGK